MSAPQPSALLPDYDWLYTRSRSGRARDPQRMAALLEQFGRPDRAFCSIRVLGTNGKGSTCAMLEAGLLAIGQQVGRFSSPHLEHFEERIRVFGHNILPEQTAQYIEWAKHFAPQTPFFEQTLLLACQVFAAAEVDWAIMEAGIGGASDCTQALAQVSAVLLTNVGLDHQNVIGSTVAEIAAEKAGAALSGVPFLTTAQGEALAIAEHICQARQAPLYTPATHPELFALPAPPALAGLHQHHNAALAVATLRLLGHQEAVLPALQAQHPARLERFVVGDKVVWLDGAHNEHGTRALAQALPALLGQPLDALLFGHFQRKDTAASLAPLLPLTAQRFFTAPGEDATPPCQLAEQYGGTAEEDPHLALQMALARVPAGGNLLVTGSLYLAGLLRPVLAAQR